MKRPSLADHVLPRRHFVGEKRLVVLHDPDAGRTACIGEREWAVLRAADGTRDLEGIASAAAVRERPVRSDHVAEFLADLERAGMLREGPPAREDAREEAAPTGRPWRALADFRLRCDGSGSCCRIYPTTVFSPLEVARARSLAPEVLDAGQRATSAFTPERGSTLPPWRARAVTMVEGRCAFLLPSNRFVLHERAGTAAKPAGCRLYPATFADDGACVRVSFAPECRCVIASARASHGAAHAIAHAPLAQEPLSGDRDRLDVEALPAALPLSRERTVE